AVRAAQAAALVAELADAAGARGMRTLELGDGPLAPARLAAAGEVEARPHLEPVGMRAEELQRPVEPRAGAARHDDDLFDVDLVERGDPRLDGRGIAHVHVRVHVDDGELR